MKSISASAEKGNIMRFKSDFVTNSSSSSFVVAIKDGTEAKELAKLLKPSVAKFLRHIEDEYRGYKEKFLEDFSDEVEAYDTPFELAIAKRLIQMALGGIKLPGWNVFGETWGDEDGTGFSFFMYDFASLPAENSIIKMKRTS